jgi:hypothetical protein
LGKALASHFCANHFSCIALNLCSVLGSYSTTHFEAQSNGKFNNEGFGKVGYGFSGGLGFAASVNDNVEEEDKDDEEEGEEN